MSGALGRHSVSIPQGAGGYNGLPVIEAQPPTMYHRFMQTAQQQELQRQTEQAIRQQERQARHDWYGWGDTGGDGGGGARHGAGVARHAAV